MNDKEVSVRGLSVPTLLGIAFIILKLCGVIRWNWLWVLAPFWIPLIFSIAFLIWFVCSHE